MTQKSKKYIYQPTIYDISFLTNCFNQ